MFGWIIDAIWTLLKTIGGWLLDLLLWCLEFVFEIVNMFLDWILGLGVELVKGVLEAVSSNLPDDVKGAMSGAFEWLAYVDEWFPLAFGIKLIVAYFIIKLLLNVTKWILKAIPTVWG